MAAAAQMFLGGPFSLAELKTEARYANRTIDIDVDCCNMASRSLCRPVLRSAAKCQTRAAGFKSFAAVREAQKPEEYTHFGFENVRAEEKAQKGESFLQYCALILAPASFYRSYTL